MSAKNVPIQASKIKKNGYAIIKGRPVKISHLSTSKTGKHGHAKVHFVGYDVFTGKKLEDISPSTHTMEEPVLTRVEYDLVDVAHDGYCSLMDDAGEMKEDLKLPQGELGEEIKEAFDNGDEVTVTVQAWGPAGDVEEEAIVQFKAGEGSDSD